MTVQQATRMGTSPQDTTTMPLVSIRGFTKQYGGHVANNNIDLDIYPHEVMALVGDNGAGKSTFIKMISGVVQPTSGTISVSGTPIHMTSPAMARAAGIETLHQNLSLVDVFTPQENIFMGRELRRRIVGVPSLNHAEMRRQTVALFEELGLKTPDLNKMVRALSGGQRQAIGIARLLLDRSVKLIIMDEPMAALGVEESRLVLKLIEHLREKGYAVFIISHNLEHVFQIADRIAVLKTGRMVGVVRREEVEHDELVSMIVGGRMPAKLSQQ
ncbi:MULTISPECIES: ATP-binding cassette domain-containing protein [Brucella]|uniref:ABC transporter family protein n=1 Tax=Brucella lupini TaxID=255457 RepID=A0A256GH32_9HYPH|nr:ATP-binding cassette domain-containing protein [Brucella lupini]OYR25921.1 ABC transporter family protein [Brucella lupini]